MAKNTAISVRIPKDLKTALEARARRQRRSLSAQIALDLESAANNEATPVTGGKLLGRFQSTVVPTDADFAEVRELLWGKLGRRDG